LLGIDFCHRPIGARPARRVRDTFGDLLLPPPLVFRGRVGVGAARGDVRCRSSDAAPREKPPPQSSPGVPGEDEKAAFRKFGHVPRGGGGWCCLTEPGGVDNPERQERGQNHKFSLTGSASSDRRPGDPFHVPRSVR
jgi:hypothetical protein